MLEVKEATDAPKAELRDALRTVVIDDRGKDADRDYARLLDLDKSLDGADSPAVITDMQGYAGKLADAGNYAAALPLYEHALEVRKELPSSFKADATKEYGQIPIVSLHKDKLGAEAADSRLLALERQLASVYGKAGKYPEAEKMYKQVIAVDETAPGDNKDLDKMELDEDLLGLAQVYRLEKRYDDALATLKRKEAVDDELAHSKSGAMTNATPVRLWHSEIEEAEIDREKGDLAAAEPIFQRSVQATQTLHLAPGFPVVAHFFDNYATLLRDEGKLDEAESFYRKAMDVWAKNKNPDQPDVAGTLTNYAALLRKMDRAAEAEKLEARAATILANGNGPEK